MRTELEDLIEHLQRYRTITLQVFDLIDDDDLRWRPSADRYSLGQQLLHIAQAEHRFTHGLFEGDWSLDRVRFPKEMPGLDEMRIFFERVRDHTLEKLRQVDPEELSQIVEIPDSPVDHTLRSWLWFILEHELHHRGQVWGYLRAMGRTPPFYAIPLAPGERPDVKAREELGGF